MITFRSLQKEIVENSTVYIVVKRKLIQYSPHSSRVSFAFASLFGPRQNSTCIIFVRICRLTVSIDLTGSLHLAVGSVLVQNSNSEHRERAAQRNSCDTAARTESVPCRHISKGMHKTCTASANLSPLHRQTLPAYRERSIAPHCRCRPAHSSKKRSPLSASIEVKYRRSFPFLSDL